MVSPFLRLGSEISLDGATHPFVVVCDGKIIASATSEHLAAQYLLWSTRANCTRLCFEATWSVHARRPPVFE